MQIPDISADDRTILRDLATKVAEIAADPIQDERIALWKKQNSLQRVRPLVLIFPEGAWREMFPTEDLSCSGDLARAYERDLKTRIYYSDHLPDDNVIEPVIASPVVMNNTGWGLESHITRPEEATGAYHIDAVLKDEADIEKILIPRITVDWEETNVWHEFLTDLFGDILTVEKRGRANYGLAPLDQYLQLRGTDNLFIDLLDNPDLVHRTLTRIVDGHLSMIRDMESQGALSLGNRNHYVCSGGVGYTDELPQSDFDGEHVRPIDQWGFATAQIFSEVSPDMHEEFALQHEKRVLELFGLNCYGCCEPLHNKLEAIMRHIPRLRRVSISPWADVEKSADILQDKCILSWKPNPAIVAGEGWSPDAVRQEIREFCDKTRGCIVEIILKDTHTCRYRPRRMWEWVQIAQEVAAEY